MQLFRADTTIFSNLFFKFFCPWNYEKTALKDCSSSAHFFQYWYDCPNQPRINFSFHNSSVYWSDIFAPKNRQSPNKAHGQWKSSRAGQQNIFSYFSLISIKKCWPWSRQTFWFQLDFLLPYKYEISLEHFRIFSWTVFKICLRLAASRKFVKLFSNIP